MIIHKLLLRAFKHGDDPVFYAMQAQDAVRWIAASGVKLNAGTRALDLGCGHGILGAEVAKHGCEVVYADETNGLLPEIKGAFHQFNIDRDDFSQLGQYDLVICSNVFEHLAQPDRFLASADRLLKPEGVLYLSWTNWLSPWGGHEFSPFHYLGTRRGYRLWDKFIGRKRKHTPYENLFPTYIGKTFKAIRRNPHLQVVGAAPRYYTEFAFLLRVPVVREFVSWNCALLIRKN
jgi:SAM-dependent methyltransferase